jgi:hypothetical protein
MRAIWRVPFVCHLPLTNYRRLFLSALTLIGLLAVPLHTFAQKPPLKSKLETKKDEDQPEKKAQWMMRGREVPPGESAAGLRLKAYRQKMAMRAQRRLAGTTANQPLVPSAWVSLGPSPLASNAGNGQDYNWVSGRATSVVIDHGDATGNTVLLGGAYGGLWRSTNALAASPASVVWTPLLDNEPSLAIGAIALQPGNSNIILVGTGETNSSGDSYYGMGMMRSTDGGTTWTQIQSAASGQSFVGVGFSKIAFSTTNTNLVVASTAGDLGFDFGLEQDGSSTARGLYYSTDTGATWNRVALADSAVPASASGVVFDPSQGASGTFYAAIRRHGIYSSTDGQHFTRLATQPTTGLASANCPATSNSTNCQIYRAEFAVTPGRNELYVWIVDAQSSEVDDGIWKTTNGGTPWSQIPDTGITNCGSGGGSDGGGCGVQQGVYNLELAAIPSSNGTDTDLYAGTINIYKCHVASGAHACSTIDANVPSDWINLTHVYGCSTGGDLAHVHPDQHGLALMVVGSTSPGYFAHDGGISRTLDGYAGLNSGTCTNSNQFDSLAQSLGSMTEFVSFSVHPSSADIMLGGTQDNGSPTTATATTTTTWGNALSGDGGFNVINPNAQVPANGGDGVAGDEWFVSIPGSVIGYCEAGTSCNDTNTFLEALPGYPNNGNIDQGPFYTNYILDPQNTNSMLIGTCRIWRGPSPTAVFIPLNPNFDTGDTTLCNGGETNQVADLDTGGPTDVNGLSNVIYATTWGYGPFSAVSPKGGEVWATTNATGGTLTNVTGSINPNNYAISSVAIDNGDVTGMTAFVGIMGFHVSHVFKTTNGGGAWTDWTGTLPDSPVTAVLVDPIAGIVYAASDVGVFSSPINSVNWTEVGSAASSGNPGYLPNAPVTAIRLFNNGTTKFLRVSTYGRGIWEFPLPEPPDYTNAISDSPQTIYAGQNATFHGTLTALNGYNSPANLSCTGTAIPSTCTPPNPVTPTAGGATYTITASGTAGDYTFSARALGTDANTIHHDAPITLHIINTDVAWTSTGSNSVTVKAGQQAAGYTFSAMPVGGSTFTANLSFACSGLPALTTCAFSPASIAAGAGTTPVSLSITTTGPNTSTQIRPTADNRLPAPWLPLSVPLAAVVVAGIAARKRAKYVSLATFCLAIATIGFLVACGGGSTPVTVTSVSGSPSSLFPNNTADGWQSQTAQFTATVSNSSAVTWSVQGGSANGTIDANGLYTAPQLAAGLPATVTITATSVSNTSSSASAQETLKTPTPVGGPTTITVSATVAGGSAHNQQVSLTVQ